LPGKGLSDAVAALFIDFPGGFWDNPCTLFQGREVSALL